MSDDDYDDVPGDTERRGFVKFCAGAVSVLLGAIPAGIGDRFFLDPLTKGSASSVASTDGDGVQKDADGFINLKVSVASLPEDGTPMSVKVYDDKVDAWNKIPNVPIGTVWLRRTAEGEVIAFNTICPHLGCAVDYRQSNQDFFCPCHTSTFSLDGQRQNMIPPRDMDALVTKLKPETNDSIWLKYQDFRAATHEKIEV